MARLVQVTEGSIKRFKQSRMETDGAVEVPVRPYRDTSGWFTGGPPAITIPLQREHGTPFCQGGGSKRPREINVPNEKTSAGGGAAGEGASGEGAPGGDAAGAGAARGGVADEHFNYGLKVRTENNGELSIQLTEDMMRSLGDRKFALTIKPRESRGKVLLDLHIQ